MFISDTHLPQLLPPGSYHDPQWYQQELEHVLIPGWHLVATTSQLPREGAFITFELLGRPVLLRLCRACADQHRRRHGHGFSCNAENLRQLHVNSLHVKYCKLLAGGCSPTIACQLLRLDADSLDNDLLALDVVGNEFGRGVRRQADQRDLQVRQAENLVLGQAGMFKHRCGDIFADT